MSITKRPKVLLGLNNIERSSAIFNLLKGLLRQNIHLFVMPSVFANLSNINRGGKVIADLIMSEEPEHENLDMVIVIDSYYLEFAQKGIVPILSFEQMNNNSLEPFDALTEKGNCFCFQENNEWDIFAALIRALENFKFSYDWRNIVKNCKSKQTSVLKKIKRYSS